MEDITKVIFRVWKHTRDVIAIFPEVASDSQNPYYCSSFEHIGQHGGCDPHGVIRATRLATPEEYAELKHELESPPYSYVLQVIHRHTKAHYTVRKAQLKL